MNEYYSPSIKNFLTLYYKRRKIIFSIFAAIVFLVMTGTIMVDPTYKAVAKILIKPNRADVYTPTSVKSERGIGKIFRFDEERTKNVEVEILKSRVILEKVMTLLRPEVIYPGIDNRSFTEKFFPFLGADECVEGKTLFRLQEDLNIKGIKNSNVIEISFKHGDPKIAARVVEELVKGYISHHMQIHARNKSFDFYQKQSDELKVKLIDSENKLEALKEKYNVSSPEAELGLLIKRESDLKADWNQTQIKINATEQRMVLVQKQLAGSSEKVTLLEETSNNSWVVKDLQDRLAALKLKDKRIESKYTDEFPFKANLLGEVRDEIEIITNMLKDGKVKQQFSTSYGTNPVHQNLKLALMESAAELKALKAKSTVLSAQLKDLQEKIFDMNQLKLPFNRLKKSVETNKINHQEYSSKFEESRISSEMDKEKLLNVYVFDPPAVPQKPANQNFFLNFILSMIFGFMAGIGFAFIMECMDDRLQTVEDVGQWLNLPVLAAVPLKSSLNLN